MAKFHLLAGLFPWLLSGCLCSEPSGPGPINTSTALCGDRDRETGEKCDGPDLRGQTCESLGFSGGQLRCKNNCQDFDRTQCGPPASCGDNNVDDVDICDGTDLDGQTCESLGYGAGTLACLANCAEFDVTLCGSPPDCGNDRIDGPVEVCDGDNFGRATCARLGLGSGDLTCVEACTRIDSSGCSGEPVDAGGADHTATDAALLDLLSRPDTTAPDMASPPDRLTPDSWRPDTVFVCVDDTYEENDSATSAYPLTLPVASLSATVCADDPDWYVLDLVADTTLSIGLSFTHSLGDIDLKLIKDGSTIGSSSSTTDNEFIETQIAADGQYLVQVHLFSGDQNDYQLNITGEPPVRETWRFETGGEIWTCPAIGNDGTIYVASKDHYLYALNPDGTQKWRYYCYNEITTSPALGSDGTIYFQAGSHLFAIDSLGNETWRFDTDFSSSDPAVASDNTVYVLNTAGVLYAVNSNGTEKWQYSAGLSNSLFSPTIASDGTVYGAAGPTMVAVHPDGTHRWTYTSSITDLAFHNSPAIGANGNIYSGTSEGLLALNGMGIEQWMYPLLGYQVKSPVVDSSGDIYFGTTNGYLYALNSDGTLKWQYHASSWILESPALSSAGDIFFGTDDNFLYAVNSQGALIRTTTTEGSVYGIPTIGADGTVYVGDTTGRIYAIAGTGSLQTGPWSKYRGDLKNTGRARFP